MDIKAQVDRVKLAIDRQLDGTYPPVFGAPKDRSKIDILCMLDDMVCVRTITGDYGIKPDGEPVPVNIHRKH